MSDAWRFVLRNWGLLAALAITFAVHAPTLRYFFDGDDFVVLGSINYLGGRQYLLDTVRMQDIVPNWRPLTAVVYTAEWKLFGLDAAAWRSVNLGVHLSSLVVLYALMLRVTRRPAVGAVAAMIFGVSGAHHDTVTYVTALPHVLSTFFVLGSLLAIIAYVQGAERDLRTYALSFVLFLLAFLSNEGSFVFAPLIAGTYALFAVRWRRAPLRLVLHAAPFAIVAAGWLTYYEAFPNPQLKFEGYYWGDHVFTNYGVYLSYLALPTRHIPLEPSTMRWIIAAGVVAACAFFAVRGPDIARVAVAGIALGLLPYAPVSIWTASRYTYSAVAFFAPLAAIAAYEVFDRARRIHLQARIPATVLALLFVVAVAGLYSWQTYARDSRSGRNTDRWQLLVNELRDNYTQVPNGTTIYIIDGPWTNPMEQYTWVPGVARAVYGDAAAFDLPRQQLISDPPATDRALFLQWTRDGLRPVAPQAVARANEGGRVPE
jgi:hypothetical protein